MQTEIDTILIEYVKTRDQIAGLRQIAEELKETQRQIDRQRKEIAQIWTDEEGQKLQKQLMLTAKKIGQYAEAMAEMTGILRFLANDVKKTRLDALEQQDRQSYFHEGDASGYETKGI